MKNQDRDVEPATIEQMTLAFLQGEINSPRLGKYYKDCLRKQGLNRVTLLEQANLSNADQNKARSRLLAAVRGPLFRGFPSDTQWVRTRLQLSDFHRLKYMNCEPWLKLSGQTRRVADGARTLTTMQVPGGSYPIHAHITAVLKAVNAGAHFPDLVLVAGESGDLILLEGHTRATAYVAANHMTPVGVFIGSSPMMKQWVFY